MTGPELSDAERERFVRQSERDSIAATSTAARERAVRALQEEAAREAAELAASYGTPDSLPAAPAGAADAQLARISRALLLIADRLPAAGDDGPIQELRSIAAQLLEP